MKVNNGIDAIAAQSGSLTAARPGRVLYGPAYAGRR